MVKANSINRYSEQISVGANAEGLATANAIGWYQSNQNDTTKIVIKNDNSGTSCVSCLELVGGNGANQINGFLCALPLNYTGASQAGYFNLEGTSSATGTQIGLPTNGSKFRVQQTGTNTNLLTMLGTGEMVLPTQPGFLAYNSANDSNVTGNGTVYTGEFDTEVYDQNGDFNNTTDTFTAPVTGKYLLVTSIFLFGLADSTFTTGLISIVTSNRTYRMWESTFGSGIRSAANQFNVTGSCIADMDASDTATVTITLSGGTLTADYGGSASITSSSFAGWLVG